MRGRRKNESGFALLLVFLMAAVLAFSLYKEIPRVAFESQRQKEMMLIERGEQYKRAIALFMRDNKRWPAKIEDLEQTNNRHYLRKRYVDPMTGKNEWRVIRIVNGVLVDSKVQSAKNAENQKQGPTSTYIGEVAGLGQQLPTQGQAVANPALRRRGSDNLPGGPGMPADGMPQMPGGAGGNMPPGYAAGQPGMPGQQGFPGQQGMPGQPGSPNQQGYPNQPGMTGVAGGMPGQPGFQGQQGMPGQPVYPNQQGVAGQTGYPNQQGMAGMTGGMPGQQGYPAQPPMAGVAGVPPGGYVMQPRPVPTGSGVQPGIQGQPVIVGQPIPGQPGMIQPGMPGQQTGVAGAAGVAGRPGMPGSQPATQQSGSSYLGSGSTYLGGGSAAPVNVMPGQPPNMPGGGAFPPGMPASSQNYGGQPAYPTNPGANGQPPAFGQPGLTTNPQAQNAAAQMIGQILTQPRPGGMPQANSAGVAVGGSGIAGFASTADQDSIIVYNEQSNYGMWEFIHDPTKLRPLTNPAGGNVGQQIGQPVGQQLGQPIGQPIGSQNQPFGGGQQPQPVGGSPFQQPMGTPMQGPGRRQ